MQGDRGCSRKVKGMLADEAHTCKVKGRSARRHKCTHEGMSARAKVRVCVQRCKCVCKGASVHEGGECGRGSVCACDCRG
jgi:hypothetical protein